MTRFRHDPRAIRAGRCTAPNRRRPNAFRRGFRLATSGAGVLLGLLGLLGLPARPAAAQGAPLPVVPHGFLGYTFCRNGMAESWIRADVVGTPQGEEVLAHEAVHREQARAFPSCEAWQASLVSAKRVVEMEIPAYCAQYRIVLARGADPDSLRLEYALRIAAQAGAIENRLDVRGMFREGCG